METYSVSYIKPDISSLRSSIRIVEFYLKKVGSEIDSLEFLSAKDDLEFIELWIRKMKEEMTCVAK